MKIGDFLAGVGILIAIYLFISNSDATVKIIQTGATNFNYGVKTLQGR